MLHVIMLLLKLLGLLTVTVPLIKEPLMKVTCATSEKSWVRFTFILLLVKAKVVEDSPVILVIPHRVSFRGGRGGGGHSPPLGMRLPPLGNHVVIHL